MTRTDNLLMGFDIAFNVHDILIVCAPKSHVILCEFMENIDGYLKDKVNSSTQNDWHVAKKAVAL